MRGRDGKTHAEGRGLQIPELGAGWGQTVLPHPGVHPLEVTGHREPLGAQQPQMETVLRDPLGPCLKAEFLP